MTGIRGVGYPGTAQATRAVFDPMNQAGAAAAVAAGGLERKQEETPEEKIKSLERRVTELIGKQSNIAARRENRC